MSDSNVLDWLRAEWRQLFDRLGADSVDALDVFAELAASYSTYAHPERVYHNLDHLRHVLETVNQLAHLAHAPDTIRLAAWFHDVVYDSRAKDNEERSAAHATTVLGKLGVPAATIRRVADLILRTKTHQPEPGDVDCQILLDADLAILGAEPQRYHNYMRGIREEYEWVADDAFRQGRRAVLQKFLERLRIYRTMPLYLQLEDHAQANMLSEVAGLSGDETRFLQMYPRMHYLPGNFHINVGEAIALLVTDRITSRRLVLANVGCIRSFGHLLTDDRSRQAVEVAERWAEGKVSIPELESAQVEAAQACDELEKVMRQAALERSSRQEPEFCAGALQSAGRYVTVAHYACDLVERLDRLDLDKITWLVVVALPSLDNHSTQECWANRVARYEAMVAQGRIIRDIIGNPFRTVTFDPAWRTATVVALAEAIYAERAFDRMPILADALEEAGCTCADILDHCRLPGAHVRGCWVVDHLVKKS